MSRLLTLLLCLLPLAARAQPALDVASDLRGVSLREQVEWLEDASGELGLEQVRASNDFRRDHSLNFGFSRSTFWLRLRLANHAAQTRTLMLELEHPLLDYVTLYVPQPDGRFEVRETGDQLPFAQRDLAYRNFVFVLEQPAASEQTFYLRVRGEGQLALPLKLWTVEEFIEHQHHDWAMLCIYYGALLVMALYALALSIFTREGAWVHFSLLVFATGLLQLAVVGHATQYLCPSSPYGAQVVVPVSLALLGAAHLSLAKRMLALVNPQRSQRPLNVMLAISAVQLAFAFALPTRMLVVQASTTPVVYMVNLWLAAGEIRRGVREAWAVLASYGLVILAGAVWVLRYRGVLPTNFVTVWSYQIAAPLQFLILGAAASSRLRVLRAQLACVTEELQSKVAELEDAVVSAERATRLAEWATRVKDEFMATMSHELRTPLNTIINIPQGLAEEFVREPQAVCGHCASVFALDPGESPERCPSCGHASLRLREQVRFAGDATRTVRYLEKIERSGTHLLGVVNGMLAADDGEVGRVVLQRSWLDVRKLAADVVEDMSDLAERAGVKLVLEAEPGLHEQSADPLRLRQVLINLIGNAIKFSNGRGTVRVQVTRHLGGAQLAVVDEGIGIAADKLESVFDSYQQAHEARAYGGTGLGLSISRSLVRAHGGELTVASELGHGASFRFTLPHRRRDQKSA